jgi:hypothetical protein
VRFGTKRAFATFLFRNHGEKAMKTLLASVFALGLMATAANAAVIGVHVGPVGVGIGHSHHHYRHYHHYHRHWHR